MDIEAATVVMRNLQKFQDKGMLVQLCVTTVAKQMDHTQLKKIHQVFAECDVNGDGTLSAEEIAACQKKLLGDGQDQEELKQLFDMLDLDGSGEVDYTEFCAAAIGENFTNKVTAMWAAFKAFDIDDNGMLSKDELAKLMANMDVQAAWSHEFCDQAIAKIIKTYDLDNDGGISFEEWLKFMNDEWSEGNAVDTRLTMDGIEAYERLGPKGVAAGESSTAVAA